MTRKIGRTYRQALAVAALLLAATPAIAQPGVSQSAASFEARLSAAFQELDRSGLSVIVGIAHGGAPVVMREFGSARTDGIDADKTQIDINSITKTVTATMILKLVDQGKVRLDERLGRMFGDVPPDKAEITVHQLLTHSAGLVESVGPDAERLTRDAFLKRIFRSKLLSKPGNKYRYSNAGYSILAAIIERRSGKSYERYLQDDVLRGLGLSDTGYMAVYDDRRSLRSTDGRTIMQASWGGHEPFWNLIGNGGLISSVTDFITFRKALSGGRIISIGALEQMQKPHIKEDPSGTSHYGYGLVVQDLPGIGRYYWHDGGNDIFSAIWGHAPASNDVIFIGGLYNESGDTGDAMSIIHKHLYR